MFLTSITLPFVEVGFGDELGLILDYSVKDDNNYNSCSPFKLVP